MKSIITKGVICLKDDYSFVYRIARIEYEEWENGHFEYRFFPFYNVIEMLPPSLFQGIPGIDLSLKRAVYERKNINPTFITERTPSEKREDVWSLLEENGMRALNRLEWLIRTNKRYSGDRFFVKLYEGYDYMTHRVQSMYDLVQRFDAIHRKLLEIICAGDCLVSNDLMIDDTNRSQYYRLLMPIYAHEYKRRRNLQMHGIERSKEMDVFKGREQIKVDPLLFSKVANDYIHGRISINQATEILKISRSTFYRRLKERK